MNVPRADHVRPTLAFAGELEQALVEDRRPRRRLRHPRRERLGRAELTGADDVDLRDRRVRLPQLVQRLGLDQVHLGETEEGEVVRLRAAVSAMLGFGDELVEARRPRSPLAWVSFGDVDRETSGLPARSFTGRPVSKLICWPDEEDRCGARRPDRTRCTSRRSSRSRSTVRPARVS